MDGPKEEDGQQGLDDEEAVDEYQDGSLSNDIKADAPLPLVMRRIPRFFRFDNASPEATGLTLDAYARGTVLMSSLFMGPALLTLANDAAQEKCNNCGDDARIYGMKPSSLLSNIGMCVFLSYRAILCFLKSRYCNLYHLQPLYLECWQQ